MDEIKQNKQVILVRPDPSLGVCLCEQPPPQAVVLLAWC